MAGSVVARIPSAALRPYARSGSGGAAVPNGIVRPPPRQRRRLAEALNTCGMAAPLHLRGMRDAFARPGGSDSQARGPAPSLRESLAVWEVRGPGAAGHLARFDGVGRPPANRSPLHGRCSEPGRSAKGTARSHPRAKGSGSLRPMCRPRMWRCSAMRVAQGSIGAGGRSAMRTR